MTMYRIDMDLESNDCKCCACDLLRDVLVPVEPTDRVCRTHNYWMDVAETICDVRWMDGSQSECDTFDVVRIGDRGE